MLTDYPVSSLEELIANNIYGTTITGKINTALNINIRKLGKSICSYLVIPYLTISIQSVTPNNLLWTKKVVNVI